MNWTDRASVCGELRCFVRWARGRGRFLLRFVLAEIELVSRGVRGYEEGMLTLCPTNNCNLSFRVHQPISRPRFESLTERDFFDELIYLCPPPTPGSPRRERRILATHEFTRPPPFHKARIQIFRWQYSRRLPANVEFQLANSILSVTFKKYVWNV